MTSLLNKPYLSCWLAIPFLLWIGFIFPHHSLDFQLYDTYVVVANRYFVLTTSFLLLVAGLGYWLLDRNGKSPGRLLPAIHILLTVGGAVLSTIPSTSPDLSIWLISAWLLAQALYLINVLISAFR